MTFHQTQVARIQTRLLHGLLDGSNLTFRRRSQQASSTTIIAQTQSTYDAVDFISILKRIMESFERNET